MYLKSRCPRYESAHSAASNISTHLDFHIRSLEGRIYSTVTNILDMACRILLYSVCSLADTRIYNRVKWYLEFFITNQSIKIFYSMTLVYFYTMICRCSYRLKLLSRGAGSLTPCLKRSSFKGGSKEFFDLNHPWLLQCALTAHSVISHSFLIQAAVLQ